MCPSRAAARTGSRSRSTGSRKPRCRSRWRSCHPDGGPGAGEARRAPAARSRGGRRAGWDPQRLPLARSRRRAERRGGARDGGDERLPRPPPRRPPLPRQTRPVLRRRGGPDGAARADRDRGPASRLRLRARDARARRLVRREALGAGCRMARGARVRHAAAHARLRAHRHLRRCARLLHDRRHPLLPRRPSGARVGRDGARRAHEGAGRPGRAAVRDRSLGARHRGRGAPARACARPRRVRAARVAVVRGGLASPPRVPPLRVRARAARPFPDGELPPHRPRLVLLPHRPPRRLSLDRARPRGAPELAVGLARTPRERARAGGVVPDLLGARAARSLVLEPIEAAAVRVAADAGDCPCRRPRARPRASGCGVSPPPLAPAPLLRAVGDARRAAAIARAVAGGGGGGGVLAVEASPPSLPFYLRHTIPVSTTGAEELTSNYIAEYHSRLRALPGSPLLPAHFWLEVLARCVTPTVFVTHDGLPGPRTWLQAALPLLADNGHYSAYGPCKPRGNG